jgi:hypothetical protein
VGSEHRDPANNATLGDNFEQDRISSRLQDQIGHANIMWWEGDGAKGRSGGRSSKRPTLAGFSLPRRSANIGQ